MRFAAKFGFYLGGLLVSVWCVEQLLSFQQQVPQQQVPQQQVLATQQGRKSVRLQVTLSPKPLQALKGQLGWKVQIPGNRPLATPAYDSGKLFIGGGFGSHEFYSLDAQTGRLVWALRTSDDGPTAAVVEDDKVIFNTESCVLICADAKTGKVLWERWMGDPLMSQPAICEGKVFMVYPAKTGKHHLACLDLQTGKILWEHPIAGEAISAPVIAKNFVYLTTVDGTLYQFTAEGKKVFANRMNATSAPTVWGRKVFVAQRIVHQKPSKGEKQMPPTEEAISAMQAPNPYPPKGFPPIHQLTKKSAPYLQFERQQQVYEAQKSHDVGVGFGVAPQTAKLPQAKANLGVATVSGVWAYQGSRPIVVAGKSYQSMDEEVRCVNVHTGKLLWRYRHPKRGQNFTGRTLTLPVTVNGKTFVGTSDGQVLCLDAKTGKVLWEVKIGEPISAQLTVAKGWVYGATDKGTVFGFPTGDSKDDGWHMWGGNPQHNGFCRD